MTNHTFDKIAAGLRDATNLAQSEKGTNMATAAKIIPAATKTLDDIKADMSELYEQVKDGTVELKLAAELANITGKYLKADQLELAREIFLASSPANRLIGPKDA